MAEADDAALLEALEQTADDLGALRIVDPAHPDDLVVAAGAPWFMTLFGRDSLLTSYMALIADHDLAAGVLRTLARLQGRAVDAATEEQPGRILHEMRFHDKPSASFADGDRSTTAASTRPRCSSCCSASCDRWGLARRGRSTGCCRTPTGRWSGSTSSATATATGSSSTSAADPTGCSTRAGRTPGTAITFADGTLPEGPIALCEVQGYVYAALPGPGAPRRRARRHRDAAERYRGHGRAS